MLGIADSKVFGSSFMLTLRSPVLQVRSAPVPVHFPDRCRRPCSFSPFQHVAVVVGLLCLRSHSRPEQVPEGRRRKMLNRPDYKRPTGREGKLNFLNTPTDPQILQGRYGRSPAAKGIRGKIKRSSSWEEVIDLVNTAKAEGKLETSVFAAAMQTCGNFGSWKGLMKLRKLQQQEGTALDPIGRNIALTALTYSLKNRRKHAVVPHRAAAALEMAKELWDDTKPAQEAETFNSGLSSALKLATCIDSDAACAWGLEVWSKSNSAAFKKDHISFSTYLCFLEQYQRCDEVDALLESKEEVVSRASNHVLLGSLLNSISQRRDWERAEALWAVFVAKGIKLNYMSHHARAQVHLLAGRPLHAVEVFNSGVSDFVSVIKQDLRVAMLYSQALLVVCHSSLEPDAMERLQAFLALALEKGASRPRDMREDLLNIRKVLKTLQQKPQEVQLPDVLIQWKTKHQSAMSEWKHLRAGSNYLRYKKENDNTNDRT